jgi:hypothetical protein
MREVSEMKLLNMKNLFVGVVAALVAIACGPDYERTEISGTKSSPLGGEVKSNHVAVPEGMIVKAHVVPYNDDNEQMQAHVWSHDPDILEVIAVVNDRDYAFIGKKPGSTTVEFQADGETVFIVTAEVTTQPPPEDTK